MNPSSDFGLPEVLIFIVVFVPYFIPTIIAGVRLKANFTAIFILNIFLGWTVIGWIVALVWAVSKQVVDAPLVTVNTASGASLCPTCGKYNQSGARFCAHCGTSTLVDVKSPQH